jgi:hypothetical protein
VNLADAIAAAHAQNEAKLAAQVPRYDLDDEAKTHLAPFIRWCAAAGVRHCPATPATVAAYIRAEAAIGIDPKKISQTCCAIIDLHDHHQLANPVESAPARAALTSQMLAAKAPRSWRKGEQEAFEQLPPEIKAAVAKREKDRDAELSRLQRELANLKRHGGAKPAIEEKEIAK